MKHKKYLPLFFSVLLCAATIFLMACPGGSATCVVQKHWFRKDDCGVDCSPTNPCLPLTFNANRDATSCACYQAPLAQGPAIPTTPFCSLGDPVNIDTPIAAATPCKPTINYEPGGEIIRVFACLGDCGPTGKEGTCKLYRHLKGGGFWQRVRNNKVKPDPAYDYACICIKK